MLVLSLDTAEQQQHITHNITHFIQKSLNKTPRIVSSDPLIHNKEKMQDAKKC